MNQIIEYLRSNKNPEGSVNKYKSERASKIASFFPPYYIMYNDDVFHKGESIVNFE